MNTIGSSPIGSSPIGGVIPTQTEFNNSGNIKMTIPASEIVQILPSVLSAGGNALALNGAILTQSLYMPCSKPIAFGGTDSVSNFFGSTSTEAKMAAIYFSGYDNSTIKPSTLWFSPYNLAARGASLRSRKINSFELTTLQALSGTLIVTSNGATKTSSTISLSALGFSAMAAAIQAAFTTPNFTVAWDTTVNAFIFTSTTTGTGSTLTFATGTIADALGLSATTGAILDASGSALDTPASAMARLVAGTQNWFAFTTTFEPEGSGGPGTPWTNKLAFSAWTNAQNQRYAYVPWDTDTAAVGSDPTACFAYAVDSTHGYEGTIPVTGDNAINLAAFTLGVAASIDFNRLNARITFAFRSQSGFLPTITDKQKSEYAIANGYNFYGAYATANDQFSFFYNGQMSGKWAWCDTYANQVYLNSQFQLALMELLTGIPSIPYIGKGYSLVYAALQDPINQFIKFGGIRGGVSLSQLQIAEINNAAGLDAASTIAQKGWYLQILDPGAQVRGVRKSPTINFWYTDGGAIQQINMPSIEIQ